MTEKDLASVMREKEDNTQLLSKLKQIEEQIKNEKGNDNLDVTYYTDCELTLGGNTIKVSIAKVDEKKSDKKLDDEKDIQEKSMDNIKENEQTKSSYNIYMTYKGQELEIAKIDEQGDLTVNEENLKLIDPKNVMGLMELEENEKPDLSQINELEGISSKELMELSDDEYDLEEYGPDFLENMEERDLEEFEEEISEEEMLEDEKLEYLMEIEAAKQGVSKDELKSNMIELELDEIKVTENKTLRQLLGTECTRVFAVPGRDASEYTIKGLNKEGKLENLDNLKKVEGTNPNQNIITMDKDGENIESKSTIAMFELEGKGMQEGIAISNGQMDYKEISYYRRAEDNKYISTPIAQKTGVDRDESTLETKELMDRNTTSQDELKEHINAYEELEEVKEQEIPDDIDITKDGIQQEDIKQGKEMMIERLVNNQEYDYNREEATIIVNNIIDYDMDFEKAKEEVDNHRNQEREENDKGRDDDDEPYGPWSNAMRSRGY